MQLSIPQLPPMVSLCIPPVLRQEAERIAAEQPPVHPAWGKLAQRGRHWTIRTSSIEDLEEVADWAQSWLVEPEEPINKAKRQAFQNVVARAGRFVHLVQVGHCHYIATGWRQKEPKAKL